MNEKNKKMVKNGIRTWALLMTVINQEHAIQIKNPCNKKVTTKEKNLHPIKKEQHVDKKSIKQIREKSR